MAKPFLFLLFISASLLICASSQGSQCTANTFQITGNGQVSIDPDIVRITITAKGQGSNAKIALNNLNLQINALLAKFNTLKIPAANYSTSSININQVYNYSADPVIIIGSQATQSLQVTLSLNVVTGLLTSLNNLNVNIENFVFDVYDRTSAVKSARIAAFNDAKNKFGQYLSLTGLVSDGLKKISDLNSEVYTSYQTDANTYTLYTKLRSPPSGVTASASVSATWKVRS